MFFAQTHIEESFGGEDIHRQSSMPEGYAKSQFRLAFEVDFILLEGHFQDALERSLSNAVWI
jgi:hypothetical protein